MTCQRYRVCLPGHSWPGFSPNLCSCPGKLTVLLCQTTSLLLLPNRCRPGKSLTQAPNLSSGEPTCLPSLTTSPCQRLLRSWLKHLAASQQAGWLSLPGSSCWRGSRFCAPQSSSAPHYDVASTGSQSRPPLVPGLRSSGGLP